MVPLHRSITVQYVDRGQAVSSSMSAVERRQARGGTLVVGGGFAGAYVARLLGKRGATIVNPDNFMLYTPLLPEAAAATLEPRHVVVPLRQMCKHAELLLGRAVSRDADAQTVVAETLGGTFEIEYERLVIALGAVPRTFPIPGLAEHGRGFKDVADAISLRNRLLRALESAAARLDPAEAERDLGFVFVGAGYAGVEALAELHDLSRDAVRRWYPTLRDVHQRWVLVELAPRILSEIPRKLGEYTHHYLERQGIEIHVESTLESFDEKDAVLSDGTVVPARTLVWSAGVRPSPDLGLLDLPLDDRGRVVVGPTLQVEGTSDVWALGDGAAVPNTRTPGRVRSAHLPARSPAGPEAREEPHRAAAAVRLPHARPGRDPRPLQGHRRAPGPPPAWVPRLVRRADVPPLRAADVPPEGPGRRRLDRLAVLPS